MSSFVAKKLRKKVAAPLRLKDNLALFAVRHGLGVKARTTWQSVAIKLKPANKSFGSEFQQSSAYDKSQAARNRPQT